MTKRGKTLKKAIAISTDHHYLTPVETLIKSIAYHHQDVNIYVINEDLPQEWFSNLNRRLAPLDIKVHDSKFDPQIIQDEKISISYLSKMAYGRILIPDLIPEDRVLYLDADIIVDSNLDELFDYDLQGFPLGAVQEYFDPTIFNSGVLLIDNQRWKQTNIVHEMLEGGKNSPADNDQTILNNAFHYEYLKLPGQYNVQLGGDLVTFFEHDKFATYEQKLKESQPFKVLHYTTSSKPWTTANPLRLRDKWWQYKNLSYKAIVNRQPLPDLKLPNKRGTLFTFTNSQDLEALDEIAKALPQYEIHVGAYTQMGAHLIEALRFPNVRLHPSITRFTMRHLLKEATAYLDINYGNKNVDIIEMFMQHHLPVLSFEDVATDQLKDRDQYSIIKKNDVNEMARSIEKLTH